MRAPLRFAQSFLPLLWEGCVPLLPERAQDCGVGSVKTGTVWIQDTMYLLLPTSS